MPKVTLYHAAPSRSSTIRWLLEEIGAPYDLHVLNLKKEENRKPDYLAINPMGKVPAIKHGDAVVTEVPAIVCYLADTFPQASLNVPVGDAKRGPYLKWLFFVPGVIEPLMMDRAFKRETPAPRTAIGYGDEETTLNVLEAAVSKSSYLLGETFTAADLMVGATMRWAMQFKLLPERPEFVAYAARCTDRPSFKRATELDGEIMKAQTG
jgi:glutathione S-transferase